MTDKDYHEFLDRATKFAALGKTGTAVDIARAIYFLASDKSSFITGDLLRVDGGRGIMHLRWSSSLRFLNIFVLIDNSAYKKGEAC